MLLTSVFYPLAFVVYFRTFVPFLSEPRSRRIDPKSQLMLQPRGWSTARKHAVVRGFDWVASIRASASSWVRALGQSLAAAHWAYAAATAKSHQLGRRCTGYNGPTVAIRLIPVSWILRSGAGFCVEFLEGRSLWQHACKCSNVKRQNVRVSNDSQFKTYICLHFL